MRSMTRKAVAGCMALAALSAVAVLDVGSVTAEAAPSVSPFAGSWSGTWGHWGEDMVGTFDWTISDAGRISGTVYYASSGRSGKVAGHVGADGDLEFVGFAPDDAPGDGLNGYPFQGTAEIDDDGKLVATLDATWPQGSGLDVILERN